MTILRLVDEDGSKLEIIRHNPGVSFCVAYDDTEELFFNVSKIELLEIIDFLQDCIEEK